MLVKTLKLEWIGYGNEIEKKNKPYLKIDITTRKPIVNKISLVDGIIKKKCIRGRFDFNRANSKMTRGVFLIFHLNDHTIYEIKKWIGWSTNSYYEYFVVFDSNGVETISKSAKELFA